MIGDDLYPNDGAMFVPFSTPKDQSEAQAAQANDVIATIPLLKEMIGRWNDRISFYRSIESIPDEILTAPEEFMHYVAANKLVVMQIEQEKAILENLISEYERKL